MGLGAASTRDGASSADEAAVEAAARPIRKLRRFISYM
ncbi:hypothetical protein PPSIR1_14940 [Plesiocystis pacifica SIR-1]|uniref:Uncharacterized protein n=1 Tax=Plesiocystis pacifica SIR-1 TaxID=391625 RepID=A6G6B5_9BACT|nr:hypothetical protein PPSIR1_14940 [Plesiocystis pacifica SIR-1]